MNWFGTLTVDNIDEVADKITEVLRGKYYTFVAINMMGAEVRPGYLCTFPDVRTRQRLSEPQEPNVWHGEDCIYAGFNFSDTYGVWGCSTTTQNNEYDPEYNNPYIVIKRNEVKITHRAPVGHLLYWTIAVESDVENVQ